MRLLGDPWQLGAVEAGGALRLLALDVGAVELTDLHRFADPTEAAATLLLRRGDPAAVDFYTSRGRLHGGTREALLDQAYAAWAHDVGRGLRAAMITAGGEDASALNARARLALVATGQVAAGGVELHDGNHAGVGDWIVTRANLCLLQTHHGRDFVKNGDTWTLTAVHADGSVRATHHRHRATVRLPATYVRHDVDLGYALTAHRAQGSTVDTARVIVTDTTGREALYVAASRGRFRTDLYAVMDAVSFEDDVCRKDRPMTAGEVLDGCVTRPSQALPATESVRQSGIDVGGARRREVRTTRMAAV